MANSLKIDLFSFENKIITRQESCSKTTKNKKNAPEMGFASQENNRHMRRILNDEQDEKKNSDNIKYFCYHFAIPPALPVV